ncbi:LTA synthase family protein [Desulfatiferula olefinivorans]
MKRLRLWAGPYVVPAVFFIVILLTLSLSRILIVCLYHARIPDPGTLVRILAYGVRIDVTSSVYCVSLPVLLAPFLEGYRFTHAFFRNFLRIWFSAWTALFVMMEAITPGFINAYDVRPNRLFVEYPAYPHEVFSMLVKGFPVLTIAGFAALFLAAWGAYILAGILGRKPSAWHPASKLVLLPMLALLLFLGGRSSLGHRPINPSTVAFSSDPLINDLPLNSTYSVLYALYRIKDEGHAAKIYGHMDDRDMIARIRRAMGEPESSFTNPDTPTEHRFTPTVHREKPLNLVIILEESLGAEFVASLGGLPLTPRLEALAREGWWFDRLYATGTRSVRGIEAVICGFPPTPGRSVVKLGKSQSHFFTLAQVLGDQGYTTRFIYGGDSNFDNMKKFFLGNGFQEVYDENDYDQPSFKGSWGVSDQDLFARAHEILSSDSDRPSFSLIFTSSNHPPYEFPDGVIDLYETPKATLHNAVTYADHALGEFFENARHSSYWDHTLFVVVADHNSHTVGETLVPIDRFRIPGLIIGPGIASRVDQRVSSQIDLPPTLLSLLGISCLSPMIGRDLTREQEDGADDRAILQYYKNQAYLSGDRVTLLQPGERADHFLFQNHQLIPAHTDDALGRTALAHALWASWTYNHRAYRYNGPDRTLSPIQAWSASNE